MIGAILLQGSVVSSLVHFAQVLFGAGGCAGSSPGCAEIFFKHIDRKVVSNLIKAI